MRRSPSNEVPFLDIRYLTLKIALQEVLQAANQDTFMHLTDFIFKQHPQLRPNKRLCTAASTRLIPTALGIAGGVNSTDHQKTFSNLVAFLQGQVNHALTRMLVVDEGQ